MSGTDEIIGHQSIRNSGVFDVEVVITLANSCVILRENSVGEGVCERTRRREDYLVCPGKVRQKDCCWRIISSVPDTSAPHFGQHSPNM